MTNDFKIFLKLFAASARNQKLNISDEIDLKKLINISDSQAVLPMIVDSLKKLSYKLIISTFYNQLNI